MAGVRRLAGVVRDAGRDAGRVGGAAGSRGIGGLGGELSHLAFVKFTWSLPLLIIKQLTHKKVQVSPIWFHLEPQCALEWPRMAIRVPGEFHEASSRRRLHSTAILEGQTREKPMADSRKNLLRIPGKPTSVSRENLFQFPRRFFFQFLSAGFGCVVAENLPFTFDGAPVFGIKQFPVRTLEKAACRGARSGSIRRA